MSGSARTDTPEPSALAGYEAPRVEQVLSPEDLERELLYAGGTASVDGSVDG